MKKLLLGALIGLTVISCSDDKKQEKAALDDVLAVHDKVMGNDEAVMKNKMKLDTLLQQKTKDSVEIKALSLKLIAAEDAMDNWMHQFEPDITGKPHNQVMTYFASQKKQVLTVDSLLHSAANESEAYLRKTGSK